MTSSSATTFACMAVLAGALVPLQAASNATLGRALGHPLWGTLASLIVSMLVLAPVLLAVRAPAPLIAQASQVPLWGWLGGIVGTLFVSAGLLLVPRLGASAFVTCVIAGQVVVSMLMDRFGLMGLPIKPISTMRVAGVLLVLAGVLTVQWSNHASKP
ncbi:DMT family transporter [Dyella sp.]|uniref:DMT family transporter n=1 Tax=Dyella sp. TaxID=1869338 RepID=UPI002ED0ACE0